ncbi:MAG TPA: cupin domain-containing protein [Steroidobacteraceae bacterium]|nr:cupin domain-containing protein [Steroidobacteraceae bacterium]
MAKPIVPSWILDGKPVARQELLSSSADGTASTYFWDCTAGRFNWFYSFDETLHILEGAVTLKFPSGASQRVVAGDTIFFPAGSSAEWTVDNYVRKLAFCRTPLPGFLTFARQLVRRLRRLGGADSGKEGSGLL